MKKIAILPIIAVLVIGGLEYVALQQGIDGSLLAVAIGTIGAIATGGTIKLWGKLKAKGLNIDIGKENK